MRCKVTFTLLTFGNEVLLHYRVHSSLELLTSASCAAQLARTMQYSTSTAISHHACKIAAGQYAVAVHIAGQYASMMQICIAISQIECRFTSLLQKLQNRSALRQNRSAPQSICLKSISIFAKSISILVTTWTQERAMFGTEICGA